MVMYRVATEMDVAELAAMRWESRLEGAPETPVYDRETFLRACRTFLQQGLADQRWTYWVATTDGQIVAHIFIQRIPKVPKPNHSAEAFGYVTNVYTRPAYRNQGIGTQLMAQVLQWATNQDLESLIVWPSAPSVRFYERAGFRGSPEMLEYEIRPYIL